FGHPTDSPLQPARQMLAGLGKVLSQVTIDVSIQPEKRKRVDKPKELHLDCLFPHRPFHQALVPPRSGERKWFDASQAREDLPAIVLDQRFEAAVPLVAARCRRRHWATNQRSHPPCWLPRLEQPLHLSCFQVQGCYHKVME